MKNSIILAAACAIMLVSCSNTNKQTQNSEQPASDTATAPVKAIKPIEINWQDGDIIAVAFLGYYNDFESFTNSVGYERYCQLYPQLKGISGFAAKRPGEDTYLVITRYADTDITVTGYDNMIPDHSEIVYKNENGMTGENTSAFLIHGYINDIKSNLTLTCTANNITLNEYAPSIKTQNGRIKMPESGGVNDISVYHNSLPNLGEATIKDNDGNEIAFVEIVDGFPFIRANRDIKIWPNIIWQLGYKIVNLNGTAVGVKVGETGKDFNPVICYIMADGTARTIALRDLLFYREGLLADAVDLDGKRIVDVVDFVTDVDGENGIKSVFAIDSKGVRHKINSSMRYGYYQWRLHPDPNDENDPGRIIEMALMQNNTMVLQVHDMGFLKLSGICRPVSKDVELPAQYEYEVYDATMTDNSGVKEGKSKGTFTINEDNTVTFHLGEPYKTIDCIMKPDN